MEIKDLEKNSKVINLVAEIYYLGELMETPTGQKVKEGIISDPTGQVKISFWNEQVDQFQTGDKILIKTGWCKEFTPKDGEPELQVSSGKFGKILKVPK